MDYTNVMSKVYDLVDIIKNSEEMKLIKELKKDIETNLSEILTRFDNAKDKYGEALKYGTYHPDLEKYKKEFSEIKTELFNNDLVKKYKELERTIQKKLDVILNEVKGNISNKFNETKRIEL